MPMPLTQPDSNSSMTILSRLLLPLCEDATSNLSAEINPEITKISHAEFQDLLTLANLNHVVVRGFEVFFTIMRVAHDRVRAGWAEAALVNEHARIQNALPFLHAICSTLQEHGHGVMVIKSLDHWPDLGSDLDLYTSADQREIFDVMMKYFHARFAPRSWGDRLACKWNFLIPGLPEPVEIHIGRLGQTGEQVAIASTLLANSQTVQIGDYAFRVPSNSHRLMISTLQRMYRHFFFRLCDIIDSASLLQSGAVDYEELRFFAKSAGIWEGVATYLAIVSDYVERYRGSGIDLPRFVRSAARFGGREIFFRQSFLRVPIVPQSVGLYGLQLTGLLRKRELQNSVRLGLLPWLATAAMVGQKLTGSDKGIW
jgi:hypothetical protein